MSTAQQCPQCGGIDRRLLAPGFWECASVRPGLMGPVPTPAGLAMVPQWNRCGHRYQTATGDTAAAGTCSCGVLAIGRCTDCGQPACGIHAVLGDRMTCRPCVDRQAVRRREAQTDAYRAYPERLATNDDLFEREILCSALDRRFDPSQRRFYGIVLDGDAVLAIRAAIQAPSGPPARGDPVRPSRGSSATRGAKGSRRPARGIR